MSEWDAPTILEAMGYPPATCDEVYQVAADLLTTAQPAILDRICRIDDVRLKTSKAPPSVLVACLVNWSKELDFPWCWAHVWIDKRDRSGEWIVLMAVEEPTRVTDLYVQLEPGVVHSRFGGGVVVEPEPTMTLFGPRDVGTVVWDPPWYEQGGGQIKRGADRHYPLVKTHDLPGVIRSCEHWDRLADDAHGYMWVTNNFLPDGLWLLEQLGFRYVTNLVWAKRQFGLGQYFRGQHELVLFGVRGRHIPTEGTWSTLLGGDLIDHPRDEHGARIHSRKPVELHELVEQASPGKWLEMFAREQRPGWLTFGNEV